jgi:hypothetical protein
MQWPCGFVCILAIVEPKDLHTMVCIVLIDAGFLLACASILFGRPCPLVSL